MNPDLVVVTITTANQFYRARLLMLQVSEHLPEATRIIYLADTPSIQPRHDKNDALVIPISQLDVPRARQLAFALDPTGYCCAQKPWGMLDALRRTKARMVLYLDNDIGLYAPPRSLLGLLASYPVVLSPHLLAPLKVATYPHEGHLLQFGPFNAGQLATDNSTSAHEFLLWWGTRLLDPRNSRRDTGYDQPWLGWAPLYFKVGVDRDPGGNVAFWNLAERPLRRDPSGWFAGDARLTTFHFSCLDENNPAMLVRPIMPATSAHDPLALELVRDRMTQLDSCGRSQDTSQVYSYATYTDCSPIESGLRTHFATAWDLISKNSDPFCRESWLQEPSLRNLREMCQPSIRPLHRRVARRLRRLFSR